MCCSAGRYKDIIKYVGLKLFNDDGHSTPDFGGRDERGMGKSDRYYLAIYGASMIYVRLPPLLPPV